MKIGAYLEQLGIPRHLSGFECAERAIQARMDGYDGKLFALYDEISEQCGHDAERSIRHAIATATKLNPDFVRMLGLPEYRQGTRISNMEFIATVAYRLKELSETEVKTDAKT